MENKYTSRDFFNAIINGTISEVEAEYAKSAIEKLDAKNANRSSKPSKKAIENEPIKASILEMLMEKTEPITAMDIATALEISTQKASALCTQLANEGKVEKTEIKVKGKGAVKGYTAVADAESEEEGE
jgi:predicted HTH transcriptional regulator